MDSSLAYIKILDYWYWKVVDNRFQVTFGNIKKNFLYCLTIHVQLNVLLPEIALNFQDDLMYQHNVKIIKTDPENNEWKIEKHKSAQICVPQCKLCMYTRYFWYPNYYNGGIKDAMWPKWCFYMKWLAIDILLKLLSYSLFVKFKSNNTVVHMRCVKALWKYFKIMEKQWIEDM